MTSGDDRSHSPGPAGRRRGTLKVLLGAAPGVGKTYAMLNEGRRRLQRGTDVVVALVETHGREQTAAQLDGLEVIPRKTLTHRGAQFTEMDLDAVLARHPQVALVDELAHTNVPGSRNARRADDVEELLAAGIDVVTTVNVQHLESLNDVVTQITGIVQRETVPDATVRAADQIELVDMDPEALRRRLAHGNVYAADKVDAALRNYFRPGNLAALRELALLWTADRVDEGLARYRQGQAITRTWQTRDRVIVALSGGKEGATLLRRGARIAHKGVGGELIAVYVARQDGLVHSDQKALTDQMKLIEDLQGTFVTLTGDDPAEVILEHARSLNATSIVVGNTRSSRWQRLWRTPVDRRIIAGAGDIDVHVVTHDWAAGGEHRRRSPLSMPRRVAGLVLAVLGPIVLTLALKQWHGHNESFAMMVFLALTVAVALVGGLWASLIVAVLGSLLVNWFFTPPLGTLTIADPKSVAALAIAVVLGIAVAGVVDRAAARARAAATSRSEADTLFLLTEQTLANTLTLDGALTMLRETFHQDAAALRVRDSVTSPWRTLAQAGTTSGGTAGGRSGGASGGASAPAAPVTRHSGGTSATRHAGETSATSIVGIDDHTQFVFWGPPLAASDERVLTAFGHQFQARQERDALRERTRQLAELEARDTLQTALLAAVSHDLRTPLAAIKASSSSLLDTEVELPAEDRAALLGMVDENADRLGRLIANLLDITRLRTGHLTLVRSIVHPQELLEPLADARVRLELEPGLPALETDAGLVERVLANLVDNAVRHQPPTSPVVLRATTDGDGVLFQVVDAGPGVDPERRRQMFQPFQQLGDNSAGVGLGLAVAAGFARSLGATLEASETPGGGLTMTLRLPLEDSTTHSEEDAGE